MFSIVWIPNSPGDSMDLRTLTGESTITVLRPGERRLFGVGGATRRPRLWARSVKSRSKSGCTCGVSGSLRGCQTWMCISYYIYTSQDAYERNKKGIATNGTRTLRTGLLAVLLGATPLLVTKGTWMMLY